MITMTNQQAIDYIKRIESKSVGEEQTLAKACLDKIEDMNASIQKLESLQSFIKSYHELIIEYLKDQGINAALLPRDDPFKAVLDTLDKVTRKLTDNG